MTVRSFAAAIAVVALTTGAVPVSAADLEGPEPPYAERSPSYDPRYDDSYRYPPPRRYAEPRYEREDRSVYRDERGYLRPFTPPRDWRRDRYASRCLPREEIRDRLESRGWNDFRDVALEEDVAILNARSRGGRWFELSLDRCSGDVVNARPLSRRSADARGPWRDRPYRGY
ncbi:MAG: hypothetical protein AB7O43_02505 [Hyphomicrobiaceae bacterium]